jgi:hypothetical protein
MEFPEMSEQSQECKLGPAQRYEVNSLIESAQNDLESVLFQLVWQREKAEAELADEREKIGVLVVRLKQARAYFRGKLTAKMVDDLIKQIDDALAKVAK